MAKILLHDPVAAVAGALSKNQRIIYRTRNGRTHAYIVENPNTLPQSERQKHNSSVFGQLSKQAYAELADPEKRAQWEKRFADYTKRHNHPSRRPAYSMASSPTRHAVNLSSQPFTAMSSTPFTPNTKNKIPNS